LVAHAVRVNSGWEQIALPDGRPYDGPVDVTLTDEEFSRIVAAAFDEILTDLGPVPDADSAMIEEITEDLTEINEGLATLDTRLDVIEASGGGGGGSAVPFAYEQVQPSALWTVPHNRGYPPVWRILDSTRREIDAEIRDPDDNTTEIDFNGIAVGGWAYGT
jgi:hypothetical protein